MSGATPRRPVGEVLGAISALRKFCLALPHAPTPTEVRQLERFECLRMGASHMTDEDIDTLRSGLRDGWRRGNAKTLGEVIASITADLIAKDRWLQSFAVAAQALPPVPERSGSGDTTLACP